MVRRSKYRVYEYCFRRFREATEVRFRRLWHYLTTAAYTVAMAEEFAPVLATVAKRGSDG